MANAIPTPVDCYVEDAASAIDLGYTAIKLYRDTTPTGSFTSAVSGGTATLAAATLRYTLTDATGASGTYFYRYTLTKADATESPLSPLIAPAGLSLRRLRLEAAIQCGLAFSGTCSALGTPTTLIDAVLRDSGVDAAFLEGAWIYRPDAAATGDRVRRVAEDGFAAASGTLTVDRAWTNAPASAEEYHVYSGFSPIERAGESYSWDRATRDALRKTVFLDLVNLGVGDGRTRRFSMAPYMGYVKRNSVIRVYRRTLDDDDRPEDMDAELGGGFWEYIDNAEGPEIDVFPAPASDEYVVVQCSRSYEPLWLDTDVTSGPEALARLAVAREALSVLVAVKGGPTFAPALAHATAEFASEYARYRTGLALVGH